MLHRAVYDSLLALHPQVLDAVRPGPDELVLPKTSSSVFSSTTLDYILRNMDKRFLIVAGCVTDQCVQHAICDAADLGYLVTMVTGMSLTGCAATQPPLPDQVPTLACSDGYVEQSRMPNCEHHDHHQR